MQARTATSASSRRALHCGQVEGETENAKEATREIEAQPERFYGERLAAAGKAGKRLRWQAAGGISQHKGVSIVSIRVFACHYHGKAKHSLRAQRHQCSPGNQFIRAAGETKETVS